MTFVDFLKKCCVYRKTCEISFPQKEKLYSTKLDNSRQIKSSLGERRISRIQIQYVQKYALELIKIFSPFLGCG